jgi:hypothetical protein
MISRSGFFMRKLFWRRRCTQHSRLGFNFSQIVGDDSKWLFNYGVRVATKLLGCVTTSNILFCRCS